MEFCSSKKLMTKKEMDDYWHTLCSLDGKDLNKDSKLLLEKIKYPKYLFRYRAVNARNLEALKNNTLYFSKATRYDDPFDTFLHINVDELAKEIKSYFKDNKSIDSFANQMKSKIQQSNINLSQEIINTITSLNGLKNIDQNTLTEKLLLLALSLRSTIQEELFSACFSEDGLNQSLWLKYANNYRGYALCYDLENSDNYFCGKQYYCNNCPNREYHPQIYPVYYSDKPYDATKLLKYIMAQQIMETAKFLSTSSMQIEFEDVLWEKERVSLIKKKYHSYDKEWRMILNIHNSYKAIKWKPDSLIIGLRTPTEEIDLLKDLAKIAGIEKIYKLEIDIDNNLLPRKL